MTMKWKTAAAILSALLIVSSSAHALAPVPRPEHPRPDLVRDSWQNLNGRWGFALDPSDQGLDKKWHETGDLDGAIVVPFPVESELSGVANTKPPEVVWYSWRFDLEDSLQSFRAGRSRLLLHFGAVDYRATVWLNGVELGSHTGGYTPFSFDISGAVKETGNLLVVRVFDSRDLNQARGKQTTTGESYVIFYTTVTGIWQTVWIEKVGEVAVDSYRFTPSADLTGGTFDLQLSRPEPGASADLIITGPDGATEQIKWEGKPVTWTAASPRTWSPDDPALYDVEIILADSQGHVLDSVKTYVGIRTIASRDGKIWLNGKDFYQKLLLDQGYFPGGVYTPADDAIMKADVEMYKRMGFNGLRKHQKIEDPRFLYWCDKLGLVVWEEAPSIGLISPATPPEWARDQFLIEWKETIARDFNHPSIITWVVFNENWGVQAYARSPATRNWAQEAIRLTRELDPTRLVLDNSGGAHFDTDVWDFHHYLSTAERSHWLYQQYDLQPGGHLGFLWSLMAVLHGSAVISVFTPGVDYQGQPQIVSEYGGFGFYRTEGDASLLDQYRDYTLAMKDYPYIRGYCYTQPYDVEQEANGLMTFDRTPKVDPEEIKKINDQMGK